MIFLKGTFVDYITLDNTVTVNTASGVSILGISEGSVILDIVLEGRTKKVTLTNVLYILHIVGSLISVSQLEDRGITIRTLAGPKKRSILLELRGKIITGANQIRKLYILNCVSSEAKTRESALAVAAAAAGASDIEVWHRRFGHFKTICGVEKVTTGCESSIQELKEAYKACDLTKTVQVVNRVSPERSLGPLDRIYTDIWGPYKVAADGRY
jgi:hypothetical protein